MSWSWKWRLLFDVLMCLKCVRHIELNRGKINYLIKNCHLNNKSHNFYFHRLSISRGLWTWSWNISNFDISIVRFNFTVKTLVCWVTTHSIERTHIFKMESIISFHRDTKYPLEISLMGIGYSRLATLVKSY